MLDRLLHHYLFKSVVMLLLFIAVVTLLAYILAPLLIPIIVSFVLFAVLEPISGSLERQGMARSTASLSVLLLLVIVTVLAVYLLLPQLSSQLSELKTQVPVIWQSLTDFAEQVSAQINASLGLDVDTGKLLEPVIHQGNEFARDLLLQASNFLFSLSFMLVLIPIFTFFLIRDYRNMRNSLLDALPNRSFELAWLIYHRVAHQLQEYIRGIMIQSLIMTLVTSSGFYLIGLPSPVLLGIIAGVLNLIPYVGPLLAMVLPVLLALGHTPLDMWLVLYAVMVLLVGQLIDNVIVVPSVIAHAVNLHPVIVIIGIIIFGNLFGFIGMILAIPVLATVNIIFRGLLQGMRTRAIFANQGLTESATQN